MYCWSLGFDEVNDQGRPPRPPDLHEHAGRRCDRCAPNNKSIMVNYKEGLRRASKSMVITFPVGSIDRMEQRKNKLLRSYDIKEKYVKDFKLDKYKV